MKYQTDKFVYVFVLLFLVGALGVTIASLQHQQLVNQYASTTTSKSPGKDLTYSGEAAVSTLQNDYANGKWSREQQWEQASSLESVDDVIQNSSGLLYGDVLGKTYSYLSPIPLSKYRYDDEAWWALSQLRAYDLTGDTTYLEYSKKVFADMTKGWNQTCGGGLYWGRTDSYKNAIPNELFLDLAAKLHLHTPNDSGAGSYLDWATKEWNWFKVSKMINSDNLINDGLRPDCRNNNSTVWTYNQGVILAGLTDLYKATGDKSYLSSAESIADAVIAKLADSTGILHERGCEPSKCNTDQALFKGIFSHDLGYFYSVDRTQRYYNFLYANAHSDINSNQDQTGQYGLIWNGPFDKSDAARQTASALLLNSLSYPWTKLVTFSRGVADITFNHAFGKNVGTQGWECNSTICNSSGYMVSGPYFSTKELPSSFIVRYRMNIDQMSTSSQAVVTLNVRETNEGKLLGSKEVLWKDFSESGTYLEFDVPVSGVATGDALEFRVLWNNIPNSPRITVNDITISTYSTLTAANMNHEVGHLSTDGLWQVSPWDGQNSGYLATGRLVNLASGNYTGYFTMNVDVPVNDSGKAVTISAVDHDTHVVYGSADILHSRFPTTLFQTFSLPFTVPGGASSFKRVDFRVYWPQSSTKQTLTLHSVSYNKN